MATKIRGGCGNPRCGASTGIHEGLTFGSGELDFNGYWEHPCAKCARAFERQCPDAAPCWPFEVSDEEEAHGSKDDADDVYVHRMPAARA